MPFVNLVNGTPRTTAKTLNPAKYLPKLRDIDITSTDSFKVPIPNVDDSQSSSSVVGSSPPRVFGEDQPSQRPAETIGHMGNRIIDMVHNRKDPGGEVR